MKHLWKFSPDRLHAALPRLRRAIYPEREPLTIAAWHVHGEPVSWETARSAAYIPFSCGQEWGAFWDTTWFRFEGVVPMKWAQREVVACVRLNDFDYEGFTAEGLIYDVEGRVTRALNVNRREVEIARSATGGEAFTFYVEAAANGGINQNGMLPGLKLPDYDGKPIYRLAEAFLTWIDRTAFDFFYDYKTALEAFDTLEDHPQRQAEIGMALARSLDRYEISNGDVSLAREALREVLSARNGDTAHTLTGIGHAHIDSAWLWPLREAIRKCARTFSTALDYMERYPEYHFSCSQAHQYAWMKAWYPRIWEGIRAAIARGQWEVVGSMWTEADCNLPSGESLVRQILYGKRFFRDELGIDTRDVWIPDVFGYPGSLPQIFRKAGVDYFLTQKIGWNETNAFPHHTFFWEGIDGSSVLTHFPPVGNYASDTGPADLLKAEKNFRQHGQSDRSLLLYGYGDGGGGPSIEQLEKARRLRDFNGLPRLESGRAIDFFDQLEKDDLPHWVGELYLENHRGTLTTHGGLKRANRENEGRLHQAELFDALAWMVDPAMPQEVATIETARYDVHFVDTCPAPDPHRDALRHAWKLLLLNQFHDIIPGSSIRWVYQDAERDEADVQTLARSVSESALATLTRAICTDNAKEPVLIFNPLSHPRDEIITLPNGSVRAVSLPPTGYIVVDAVEAASPPSVPVSLIENEHGFILDNGLIRAEFNHDGEMIGCLDLKLQRSILKPGHCGNQLHLHADHPAKYDAWNIDREHRNLAIEIGAAERIVAISQTPWEARLGIEYRFSGSWLRQEIVLRAGSPRLDFETEVEWQEEHQMLKVAFPVNVFARRARYEIQFGHIERPTHFNTSWDMAMFENCAHRWADLSESGFGVALLNDCKYGYDLHDDTLRLSLLRSSVLPDPLADRGRHHFTYSLLSHDGDFRKVIPQAAQLNRPPLIRSLAPRQQGSLPSTAALIDCQGEGLILDTVKRAEEGDALILRLYEAHGGRGEGRLCFHFPIADAQWCDLLEDPNEPADLFDQTVSFSYEPFEICTLRIKLTEPLGERS